ncbi:gap junction protein alpha 9a [Gadus chalcogrammus]|uniref:gap junction protein alpha 9a n=1 Tax=Gadus chalcogrammus TaxID=1042646 RepID=UPI0024C2E73B|nr:gap junction protein alpha 9a [Gadus chalcogrammus]
MTRADVHHRQSVAGAQSHSHGRVKMGDWNFLGGILEEVHIHSTTVGKIWLTILFIFRMLVLGVAAEDVWNDEQSAFVCNTEQPGCRSVCYDRAFPISLIRYWVLQVIFVSAPSLVYMGHALYRLRALEKVRQRRKGLLRRQLELLDAAAAAAAASAVSAAARRRAERQVKQVEQGRLNKAPLRGALLRTYVAHVFTRSAVEVGFMAGQYLLYGARLRPLYRCERAPCPNAVDCYVSRPTEKSVFMAFMQAIAGVSLLLNLLEILHLGYKKLRKVFSYGPRPPGGADRLLDGPHPDARYRGSSLGWGGGARAARKTTVASAPSDYDLLLERARCGSTCLLHPPLPPGGAILGDPECPGCGPVERELSPSPPGSHRLPQEGGGEEEDRDTSDADLPALCSPKRCRGAGPAPPGCAPRRQWNRCSTVMESRSSDTDSYGDATALAGGGGGPPGVWTRAKADRKRPSPRPSSPESQEGSSEGTRHSPRPSSPESQEDSSEGTRHSPRPPSSNCKTSMGSSSSSRRPDLQI